jgi:hypothetical protein
MDSRREKRREEKMVKEKIYERKRKKYTFTLSDEAAEFLHESVTNASRFIESLIMSSKTEIRPVIMTVSRIGDQNRWACPGSNRRSSPCKGDVITD